MCRQLSGMTQRHEGYVIQLVIYHRLHLLGIPSATVTQLSSVLP